MFCVLALVQGLWSKIDARIAPLGDLTKGATLGISVRL